MHHVKLLPALTAALLAQLALGASPRKLDLQRVTLDLPGVPSAMVAADLDGDGNQDLLVVVAHTNWGSITEDHVEAMVEMIEVVPALFEQREARAWLGDGHGGYRPVPGALSLPTSVVSVEEAGKGLPPLALTDEGMSEFRLIKTDGTTALSLEPVLAERPVFAGSGVLLPNLGFARDLDGDGKTDVLIPARSGPAVYLQKENGFDGPVQRLELPGDTTHAGSRPWRSYPLPEIGDLDGDGLPDLLLRSRDDGDERGHLLLRGLGGGRFDAARRISPACFGVASPKVDTAHQKARRGKRDKEKSAPPQDEAVMKTADEGIVFIGDVDGDRSAEVVVQKETDSGDGGLKEAKQPHSVLEFHHVRPGLVVDPEAYERVEITGYLFGGQWPDITEGGLQDLDGDGRRDLVTITLDFSVFQIVRVLATKTVSIGVDFHVWSQGPDGKFHEVPGLDLTEKLHLDLNNLELGRFAEFGGDFDGDGMTDFIHLGRGTKVTIHRGQPGCRYAAKPDLTLEVGEEIKSLGLVRVRDLDGDGRADLAITRPQAAPEEGVTVPVKLELYLSGGSR